MMQRNSEDMVEGKESFRWLLVYIFARRVIAVVKVSNLALFGNMTPVDGVIFVISREPCLR